MKISFISYCDGGGGAAKAVFNLYKSFKKKTYCKLIVIDKREKNNEIILHQKGIIGKIFRRLRYLVAQLIFLNQKFYVMSLNIINSNLGKKINKLKFDIVNLHWINCETISLSEIKKINKPIVWTLHDMWPISGIYHYNLDKKYFNAETKNIIIKKYFNFLDRLTKNRKQKLFTEKRINIISPSKWLLDEAKRTNIPFGEMINIPNPINTKIFKKKKNITYLKRKYQIPLDKKILLFSSLKLDDKRKGYDVIKKLINMKINRNYIFIFFGINNYINKEKYPLNVKFIDETYKENKIVEIYSISDILLFPSIIDNFPNTILEAMSCNLPCVAFNCYGMKEIISHKKSGYLVKPYSVEDFTKGVNFILNNKKKFNKINIIVKKNFSYNIIKKKYNNFFKKIIKKDLC